MISKTISSRTLRITTIVSALIGGLIVLWLKFYAAKISNSMALRSDALESSVNVLAAAFGLGSLLFSEQPADKGHPYGHGKIEYFAAAFEGGLISLAGFLIFIDSISRMIHPVILISVSRGLAINAFAGGLNGIMGVALYWIGKRHRSEILRADGVHLLTDLATTGAILLGLGLMMITHLAWIDAVIATGISFFLFGTGFQLVKQSANALLDAQNPQLVDRIVESLNRIPSPSIVTIHELKAQQFGRESHIDLHLVVPEFLSVKEAHDIAEHFMSALRKDLGVTEIHTHLDPCERLFCDHCPQEACPIRKSPFQSRPPYNADAVTEPGMF